MKEYNFGRKTLKDFEIENEIKTDDSCYLDISAEQLIKELREEAIKWLKEMIKDYNENDRVRYAPNWIIHFFNIPKEVYENE